MDEMFIHRYAQLCYYILEDMSLTAEQFAHELLPSLLSLGADRIPNVRISLAKVLAQHIMHSGSFPQCKCSIVATVTPNMARKKKKKKTR